jgi:hypothetical protein
MITKLRLTVEVRMSNGPLLPKEAIPAPLQTNALDRAVSIPKFLQSISNILFQRFHINGRSEKLHGNRQAYKRKNGM